MEADVIKIKIARQRILQCLNMMYPTSLQLATIFNAICYTSPDYELALFRKDIHYLADKGWLKFIDEKIGGFPEFQKKVVGLTAEGKEIAEKTQTDPALEI